MLLVSFESILVHSVFKKKKNNLTYKVPEMMSKMMENEIKAIMMEKIDNSAALYSALVLVNCNKKGKINEINFSHMQ